MGCVRFFVGQKDKGCPGRPLFWKHRRGVWRASAPLSHPACDLAETRSATCHGAAAGGGCTLGGRADGRTGPLSRPAGQAPGSKQDRGGTDNSAAAVRLRIRAAVMGAVAIAGHPGALHRDGCFFMRGSSGAAIKNSRIAAIFSAIRPVAAQAARTGPIRIKNSRKTISWPSVRRSAAPGRDAGPPDRPFFAGPLRFARKIL